MYLKLARLCMNENYFTFRGSFYKQTKGAPMGNPLSPFLCELFMANLEDNLEEQGVLPEKWWRYVDDIFSIINRKDLPRILEAINNVHKDIKFTHEEEKEGSPPTP
ncbi:telomerase reverse transcriptase-like [Armigeres subalbatus]|uniref:telomerase reverse transcriptase-like n=1 Tax=Armigeres subalbatus TaxID=124917 RepID=UPI002ED516CE